MDSYTNPYGSQPSIPNGGQYQPTNYPPQGDIILTPSQPRKFDLKRILILVGIGLAVLTLFIVVIVVISGNNRTASEAKAADRAEKIAAVEGAYDTYEELIESYKTIGYIPSENISQITEDTGKFFVVRSNIIDKLEILENMLEKDLEKLSELDFSAINGSINERISQVISEIKPSLENIKANVVTLKAFYDAFVVPIQNDLDEETAVSYCRFSLSIEDLPDSIINSIGIENAVEKYNQAYCAVNDELYYGIFDGSFDSPYIVEAKEALIDGLLIVGDQSDFIEELKQILIDLGSSKFPVANIIEDEK